MKRWFCIFRVNRYERGKGLMERNISAINEALSKVRMGT